jgi:hypothetical protein
MRITERNVNRVAAATYSGASLAAAGTFLAITTAGDYDWVARVGGAAWIFLLSMIILMPTVPALLRARVTGGQVQMPIHDHEAMMSEEGDSTR